VSTDDKKIHAAEKNFFCPHVTFLGRTSIDMADLSKTQSTASSKPILETIITNHKFSTQPVAQQQA